MVESRIKLTPEMEALKTKLKATDGATSVDSEYLEVVACRE